MQIEWPITGTTSASNTQKERGGALEKGSTLKKGEAWNGMRKEHMYA